MPRPPRLLTYSRARKRYGGRNISYDFDETYSAPVGVPGFPMMGVPEPFGAEEWHEVPDVGVEEAGQDFFGNDEALLQEGLQELRRANRQREFEQGGFGARKVKLIYTAQSRYIETLICVLFLVPFQMATKYRKRAKSRSSKKKRSHPVRRHTKRRRGGDIAADLMKMAQRAWMRRPSNFINNLYNGLGRVPNAWMGAKLGSRYPW